MAPKKRKLYKKKIFQTDLLPKTAPVRTPTEILGEVAAAAGLRKGTRVSTGTWVIAMSVGVQRQDLALHSDTLINVNARGCLAAISSR